MPAFSDATAHIFSRLAYTRSERTQLALLSPFLLARNMAGSRRELPYSLADLVYTSLACSQLNRLRRGTLRFAAPERCLAGYCRKAARV
jgi:hypothetical protein